MAKRIASKTVENAAGRDQVVRIGIVGGGVAGISAARAFLQLKNSGANQNIEVTIFEKGSELGGVWTGNYAGFGIQVPAAYYEFADERLPEGSDFASGADINAYIKRYADKHGISDLVHLNTDVIRVEVSENSGLSGHNQWNVHARCGSHNEVFTFDYLCICIGVYSKVSKCMPVCKNAEKFADPSKYMHCADFGEENLKSTKGQDVVVVGYGKSALDCAMQASLQGARSSTLLFREAHWCLPRKLLGMVPFEFATFNRFGHAVLTPTYHNAGPIERFLHALPFVLNKFWRLVEFLLSLQYGYYFQTKQCRPKKGIMQDIWEAGGVIVHPDFFPMVASGKIKAVEGTIAEVRERGLLVETRPGESQELPADVVVYATGYRHELGDFLPSSVKALEEKDGLWLHRQVLHPNFPTLAFVGSQVTTFINILTPALQARWLATKGWNLEGRGDVMAMTHPQARREMQRDINAKKAWKRNVMPGSGHSTARIIQTHQVHYYDELMKDMGYSIRRKTGMWSFIKEIFIPYRPRDYEGVVLCEEPEFKAGAPQPSFLREGALVSLAIAMAIGATRMMNQ